MEIKKEKTFRKIFITIETREEADEIRTFLGPLGINDVLYEIYKACE